MAFLLDTNVISEMHKPRPHGAVRTWIEATPDSALHLCAVTLGEIQRGIERTREQDPIKATEIEAWANLLVETFDIIPMDARIFQLHAKLMHRRTSTLYEDAMLAACALQHRLTVVTRNVRDFKDFGVSLLNPFETEA